MSPEFEDGLLDFVLWPHIYEKYRSYIRMSTLIQFVETGQHDGANTSGLFERARE